MAISSYRFTPAKPDSVVVMALEHYKAKCGFCKNDKLTFHVENGKKVLDSPCGCAASKAYFSPAEVAKRAELERKERVRLGLEKDEPKQVATSKKKEAKA